MFFMLTFTPRWIVHRRRADRGGCFAQQNPVPAAQKKTTTATALQKQAGKAAPIAAAIEAVPQGRWRLA